MWWKGNKSQENEQTKKCLNSWKHRRSIIPLFFERQEIITLKSPQSIKCILEFRANIFYGKWAFIKSTYTWNSLQTWKDQYIWYQEVIIPNLQTSKLKGLCTNNQEDGDLAASFFSIGLQITITQTEADPVRKGLPVCLYNVIDSLQVHVLQFSLPLLKDSWLGCKS